MSACLAVSAQCYARSQDRIFHLLVTPEFESSRDFCYPSPASRAFGLSEARHLQISSHGKRLGVRYGISLESERIRIVI